tara:strand:+ start:165 stop:410 length:246 start_codon:yes stop_codon:yes gene_type:complete
MKQYTLRQIQDLPFEEKDKVLSEPCELGFKTSGPKTQFKALGVYLPMGEHDKLKETISQCLGVYDFSNSEREDLNKILGIK